MSTIQQVSFKPEQTGEITFGGRIPKPIERSFLIDFISQQIEYLKSGSGLLKQDTLKASIDLISRFNTLNQAYEPHWDHSSNCQDYHYHFLDPYQSMVSPVSIFTITRKRAGISGAHKNIWDGCLSQWDAVFSQREEFRIITLPKAKLLSPENLGIIKWSAMSMIIEGQPVNGNRLYYTNGMVTYCLPLIALIGCSPQYLSIKFDNAAKKFFYSYSVGHRAAGSGWYQTEVYEGSIDISTWHKEEILVEVSKDKWD